MSLHTCIPCYYTVHSVRPRQSWGLSQAHIVRPYDKAGSWEPFSGVAATLEAYNPSVPASPGHPPLHKGGKRARNLRPMPLPFAPLSQGSWRPKGD